MQKRSWNKRKGLPRPICKRCDTKPGRIIGRYKDGSIKYNIYCNTCTHKHKNYKEFKKDKCSLCPFIPIDPCQMDIDHIDGNHSNNDPSNLQVLCANCHRLKTLRNKDYKK